MYLICIQYYKKSYKIKSLTSQQVLYEMMRVFSKKQLLLKLYSLTTTSSINLPFIFGFLDNLMLCSKNNNCNAISVLNIIFQNYSA